MQLAPNVRLVGLPADKENGSSDDDLAEIEPTMTVDAGEALFHRIMKELYNIS